MAFSLIDSLVSNKFVERLLCWGLSVSSLRDALSPYLRHNLRGLYYSHFTGVETGSGNLGTPKSSQGSLSITVPSEWLSLHGPEESGEGLNPRIIWL